MDCMFPLHREFKTNYLLECSGLGQLEFNFSLLTSEDSSILPGNHLLVYHCYYQNSIFLECKLYSLADFYLYC